MKSLTLRPKKNLGQNFLKDTNVVDKIIHSCNLQPSDDVLEIGPGLGALTTKIFPLVHSLYAVEKDRSLYTHLYQNIDDPRVKIFNQDFLGFNFSAIPSPIKVIGNLPYNISSPIIEKLIQNREKISGVFITVQLEFAQRLTAQTSTKDYSALTCAIEYYAIPQILFTIKRSSFSPIPKIESAFVQINFKKNLNLRATDEKFLFKVIKAAFQQRRKQLKNALAAIEGESEIEKTLQSLSLDPKARAENLTINDFVKIANALSPAA